VSVRRIDFDADDYTSQLWLVPTDGSGPAGQLTHGWRDDAPPVLPDGQWLAFTRSVREDSGKVGRPQLWVLPTGGGDARQLTDLPSVPAVRCGARTRPGSRSVARCLSPAGTVPASNGEPDDKVTPGQEPPRRITSLMFRLDDLGFTGGRRSHVWTVDAVTWERSPPG
jgi:dipeptidyl aminopeptidase/acylaminoacyl peptidase